MKKDKFYNTHYLEAELPLDTVLNPGLILFSQNYGLEDESSLSYSHDIPTQEDQ